MTTYRMNDAGEWVRLPEPEPINKDERTMAEVRREAHRLNPETEILRAPNGGKAGIVTPKIHTGPRGGTYTTARTKDGRQYRKYF